MAHASLTTHDRRDEQQRDRRDEQQRDRRDEVSLCMFSETDRRGEQTVNRKATDVAPGSVQARGQVTVRSVAPTWEGGR